MNWPRLLVTVVAGFGAALVAYGIAYTHGNPRPEAGDPLLAYRLIPLELLAGLLFALAVSRLYGRRTRVTPRDDIAERMVLRHAMRLRGAFTLQDLVTTTPLDEGQAQSAVGRLMERGQLRQDEGRYRLA